MRYGVTVPNLGVGDDPRAVVELIVAAERSGWDGCFLWDAPFVGHANPKVRAAHDAWQLLALAAARTNRIVLGTMITPLPWRRPWLVARDAVTLDRLSGGRFILGVGLGSPPGSEMSFSEELDRRTRAVMLDESLDILKMCWSGESFDYEGDHYAVSQAQCLPRPTAGTIPVWVVGAWNRNPDAWPIKKSMRRALRWDGILPNLMGEAREGTSDFDDISSMSAWINRERDTPFDVVVEVGTPVDENTSVDAVRRWANAGATWWLERVWYSMYRHPGDPSVMQTRIESGPPTI